MSSANGTTNGYLLSSDWLIFNGKFNTPSGTTLQYLRGDGSLATFPSLTGYVPYTGATQNVDLGTHTLSAKDLVINHSSGSGVAASITKGGAGEALTVNKTSGSGNAMSVTGGVTQLDELHLTTDLADAYIASAATWNAKVPSTRTISTTAPLSGGGDLSANRTLSIAQATTSVDGYLSATDWTTFNGKQDALVSGTNIKTVNSTTLLGSGNIAVEPTITAGTTGQYYRGDKTFQTLDKTAVGLANVDNTSDANKPISTDTQTALNAKQDTLTLTTTGTSGAATLTGATLNIPQYSGGGSSGGANTPVKLGSGGIYSNIPIGASASTVSLSNNIMYLAPFIPAQTFTISDFKINVTTLGIGNFRILLYSHSDTNGLPDVLLYESSDLSVLTTGIKTATTTQTFTAGTTYWLGVYGSSTVQVAASVVASQNQIGMDSNLSQYSSITRTATFGSAFNPFGTTHIKTSNTFTRIGLTVA
jgi:hypothetical protein